MRRRPSTGLLTRRAALGALGLGGAGLLAPRFGLADDVVGSRRRFLFIHCWGGWDTTYCFQPNFGSKVVTMEADAVRAEVGGIAFVDSPRRPFPRAFFEAYADRTCILNGVEVPSVTHERCSRLVMTGSAEGAKDDWGAQIAGAATDDPILPYLVLSGTAFSATHADRVVRVGRAGQLTALLSGDALLQADTPFAVPSSARSSLVDAYVRERMAGRAAQSAIAAAGDRALGDVEALQAYVGTLDIQGYDEGCYQLHRHMATVWDVFSLGLARTALIEYRGWCSESFDTHTENARQSIHFDELFDLLAQGMADLDGRLGPGGGPLAEETVIVVFSEMGRTPILNAAGGRDHWTYTSAMVIGAGVRGGQVVGGYDTSGYGAAVDFATGEALDEGTGMDVTHLGATLLALGDVDPGEVPPVTAVLA